MKLSNYKYIFLIIVLAGYNCFGQTDSTQNDLLSAEYLASLSLEEILNISITASSKFEQRAIESPSVISVVTAKQIKDYGWNSINDILYKQPGFGPSQDYDRHTVGSRGLFEGWNNNHLLLLVDGIPMNDNLYGSAYTWNITPIIFAENIEILRGPGSALYGTNATNGVIQINTINAENVIDNPRASIHIGSQGEKFYNIIIASKTDYFSLVTAYNHYSTEGNEYFSYDGSGVKLENNELQKFLTNDHRHSSYFWTKIKGADKFSDLTFQYHYQHWEFQTGHGWLWFIPDFRESMEEHRHLISLMYNPTLSENLSSEISARYQIHDIRWNTRYYPDQSFDGYYPAGMWEYLDTKADDLLFRAQLKYTMPENASLLLGIESNIFFYDGDEEHFSNVDIDNGSVPNPDNSTQKLGPWLDYIDGHTLNNIGIYSQLISGSFLDSKLNITIGARYDIQFFDYEKIDLPKNPMGSKTFSHFSPRIALVYMFADNLALKLMYGNAFRAPHPTEMFGAHTYSLASNIEGIKPEILTTHELALDWIINEFVNFRSNIFYTEFENQIFYSAQNNNLSTNVYSSKNTGLETELLIGYNGINGFLNFSFVKHLSETILDSTIISSDNLTWSPPIKINFGISYEVDDFQASLSGHFQDRVKRRASDRGVQDLPLGVGISLDMNKYRGEQVNNWITFDLSTKYQLSKEFEIGLSIYNLFNTEYFLVKNLPFPFDYKQIGRQVSFNCSITF